MLSTDIEADKNSTYFCHNKNLYKNILSKVYKYYMKILAVQSRMGIGDTVIFLPFMKALFKKFNSPISILVKEKL